MLLALLLNCHGGGQGLEPQTGPTHRVVNSWRQSAAFVMTSANGETF